MLFQLIEHFSTLGTVQKIVVSSLPIIFAITVHEAAHGFAARYFGDMTAARLGRISLNPLRHIDLFGTLLLPALTLIFGGILFGWAKPVPVNFAQLRHPKQDMLWVAAAGPGANLLMALLWAMVIKIAVILPESMALPLSLMGAIGIMINTVLMVLNLLPLPPLDGGRIAISLLPSPLAVKFSRIEPYGFIVLIILLATGVLSFFMQPLVLLTLSLINQIFW